MTDRVASAASTPSSDETSHLSPEPAQLRFPIIDLNTSLESLLTHSAPTVSEASTIMRANAPLQPAMDESWASLDISNLSHDDDDTESVNTDGGSLVDLSSVHDAESAADDELQSEMGVNESRDSVVDMLRRGLDRHAEQAGQPDQQDVPPYDAMDDTVIFQQSATQHTSSAIDVEYVRDASWNSDPEVRVREVITMAISPNDLTSFDSPVRVYYHGSLRSPQSRDELLGKIGAALLTPSSNSSSRTSTASTCFNIVPTEFGPGSKPAFADLIPSQAQMTVDELSAMIVSPIRSEKIRFVSTRGTIIDSDLTSMSKEAEHGELGPDLLVIHLSRDDTYDGYVKVKALIRLATRHYWPTIIVAQESSAAQKYPYHLVMNFGISIDSADDQLDFDILDRRPIDLDTFMAMDTAQLSRHIMHIMEKESVESGANKEQPTSFVNRIHRSLFGQQVKKPYVLRVYNQRVESSNKLPEVSLSRKTKQVWSTMGVGQYMKDILFTLIVMMLGIYIVGFSQNMTSKVNSQVGIDNTTMMSNKTEGTATVTATSAITSTTDNTVVMVDHDVALYDPVSFDQMWHRLTGRSTGDQEEEKASSEVEKEVVVEEPIEAVEKLDMDDGLVKQFAGWFQSKLELVKLHVARPKFSNPMKSLKIVKKQMEVRELHQKLQDFYSDAAANVPKMSLATQEYLQDLVARSHYHLKQTRFAGARKLERLIAEQKTLLSQAQYQAQHIVAAKKPRRSIFGRRRG